LPRAPEEALSVFGSQHLPGTVADDLIQTTTDATAVVCRWAIPHREKLP
jgi:hypothetical protein